MAILVDFFAGDSAAIAGCLDSGGWPPELPGSSFGGKVGFKFGIMPEQAFDALILCAVEMVKVPIFRFEECVTGRLAHDGECFQGVVSGPFIGLFSRIPDHLIGELSTQWTARLCILYKADFPASAGRKRTWVDKVGSAIEMAVFGAVVFPIVAICHLNPSFRRERAMNKKKIAEREVPVPPSNEEQITGLIQLCKVAEESQDSLVYTWHI